MKATRRNLPFDHYKIVETFSTNECEYFTCENCGKVIKNIAIIENSKGQKFYVGLDCASTLSGISEHDIEFYENNFNIAKRIKAKVKKYLKEGGILSVQNKYYDIDYIYIEVKKKEKAEVIGDYYFYEKITFDFLKRYLSEYVKIALINTTFKKLERDFVIISKNEKTLYDNILFVPTFPFNEKYNYQFCKVELYKDNKLIAEGKNCGKTINSANTEAIRQYNQYKFDIGLKSIDSKSVLTRE